MLCEQECILIQLAGHHLLLAHDIGTVLADGGEDGLVNEAVELAPGIRVATGNQEGQAGLVDYRNLLFYFERIVVWEVNCYPISQHLINRIFRISRSGRATHRREHILQDEPLQTIRVSDDKRPVWIRFRPRPVTRGVTLMSPSGAWNILYFIAFALM